MADADAEPATPTESWPCDSGIFTNASPFANASAPSNSLSAHAPRSSSSATRTMEETLRDIAAARALFLPSPAELASLASARQRSLAIERAAMEEVGYEPHDAETDCVDLCTRHQPAQEAYLALIHRDQRTADLEALSREDVYMYRAVLWDTTPQPQRRADIVAVQALRAAKRRAEPWLFVDVDDDAALVTRREVHDWTTARIEGRQRVVFPLATWGGWSWDAPKTETGPGGGGGGEGMWTVGPRGETVPGAEGEEGSVEGCERRSRRKRVKLWVRKRTRESIYKYTNSPSTTRIRKPPPKDNVTFKPFQGQSAAHNVIVITYHELSNLYSTYKDPTVLAKLVHRIVCDEARYLRNGEATLAVQSLRASHATRDGPLPTIRAHWANRLVRLTYPGSPAVSPLRTRYTVSATSPRQTHY
ncbi:hypothetical protein LTR53_015433 [Teratosphaeriaceae sp. CCFEE 6253]|nr:hypothetical protein LTR53_015433 [Teratosphaeriaceae sp. CCFEE 6253]